MHIIMERARHRLRSIVECVTNVMENERRNVGLRNFTKCDSYKVKLWLITGVMLCICISSLEPVLSAEVGVRGPGQSDGASESVTHREILHRNSSRSRGEFETGENVGNSSGTNVTGNIPETPQSALNKKPVVKQSSHKSSYFNTRHSCKNCSDRIGHGSISHDHDHDSNTNEHDRHKLESILRDIFLDELETNAFDDEEDDDDFRSDLQHLSEHEILDNQSNVPISRHARSEPEPLFPEGRANQGGKAKGTRAAPGEKSNGKNQKRTGVGKGKNKKKASSKGSDLAKYNEYMDAVFNRMNVMIKKKRMDPLRVNLYAGPSKEGPNKKKSKNGTGNKKSEQKHRPRMDLDSDEDELDEQTDSENGPARKDIYLQVYHENEDQDGPLGLDEEEEEETHEETVRKIRALLDNAGNSSASVENGSSVQEQGSEGPRGNESKPKKPKGSLSGNRTGGSNPKDKGQKGNNNSNNKKNKNSSQSQEFQKDKNKNKNKNKKQAQRSKPTRGILHGLSSLKRDGDVVVIRQGDKVRVVRANFLLGPVSLEIMPKKTRADDDDDSNKKPVAAATASKLKGVLEVRLKKGAPTRIRKLRVYPPKSVKVDGTDGSTSTTGLKQGKPQQYGKVTPMATARLRQIASTVVRQTDNKKIQPVPS